MIQDFCFWAVWAVGGRLWATFEGSFFMFSGPNFFLKSFWERYRDRSKNLHNKHFWFFFRVAQILKCECTPYRVFRLGSRLNFLLPFNFTKYFLKSRPCENSLADFCISALLKTWLSVEKDDFLSFQKSTMCTAHGFDLSLYLSIKVKLPGYEISSTIQQSLGPMVVTTVHRKREGAIMTKPPTDFLEQGYFHDTCI